MSASDSGRDRGDGRRATRHRLRPDDPTRGAGRTRWARKREPRGGCPLSGQPLSISPRRFPNQLRTACSRRRSPGRAGGHDRIQSEFPRGADGSEYRAVDDRRRHPSLEKAMSLARCRLATNCANRSWPVMPGRSCSELDAVKVTAIHGRRRRRLPCGAISRGDGVVDPRGFEPLTFSLRTRRATNCAKGPASSGQRTTRQHYQVV
jgi:hypothetical protein